MRYIIVVICLLVPVAAFGRGTPTDLTGINGFRQNVFYTPANGDETYAANYHLTFKSPLLFGDCEVELIDSLDDGSTKGKFIVANQSRAVLSEGLFNTNLWGKAVLYGGLGNRLRIEVNGTKKELPIEPVGVIVLGIDGLRQDVLYDSSERQVNDPSGNYYVEPSKLTGLCEVIGGKSGLFGCDAEGWENRHTKLQNVTAIFPSITYASWAAIFTGQQAGETGIMGNEYFGRDLYLSNTTFEGLPDSPPGMVTYSDGAFKVGSGLTGKAGYYSKYILPADWHDDSYKINAIPRKTLQAKTVYESIMPLITGYHVPPADSGINCEDSEYECRSVVVFNHYAKGADRWRTMSSFLKPLWDTLNEGSAYLMDSTPAYEARTFISKYFEKNKSAGKRKRFPALFTVYFAGLDHEAHDKGMGEYVKFFKETTDEKVKEVTDALKQKDEFDNKIFVVVSDHGMTAMPTNLTLEEKDDAGNIVKTWVGDTSCSLNIKGFGNKKVQFPEQANNNIHIWELGEALRSLQEKKPDLQYKVLAPEKIAELFIDTPAGARKNLDPQPNQADFANVVAAFNGPMAHIYFRGQNGWQYPPNPDELKKFAEVLRVLYQVDSLSEAQSALGIDMVGYLNLLENTIGRMKQSVDKILIRIGGEYLQFDGYTANGYAVNPLSFTAEYIKAPERVAGLNHPKRSGDIVLLMKDSTVGPDLNRYTTGVACKSWHGSLNVSDSYVPFIVAYPGGNKYELTPLIDGTQGCNATQGCDGNWRVTDLIKTIIQKQYGSQ